MKKGKEIYDHERQLSQDHAVDRPLTCIVTTKRQPEGRYLEYELYWLDDPLPHTSL